MINSLAVYCGALDGRNPLYKQRAFELGQKMAAHHIDLVYGAGQYGLMGAVARGVIANGGKVHGVITRELADRGVLFSDLHDVQIVDNMDRRKEKMMQMADGMLALPGGLGTLEEISQAASWVTIGDNAKPVAFYNINGFYTPLKEAMQKMVDAGFLEQKYLDSLCFSDHFDHVLDFMVNYQAPQHRQYNKKS